MKEKHPLGIRCECFVIALLIYLFCVLVVSAVILYYDVVKIILEFGAQALLETFAFPEIKGKGIWLIKYFCIWLVTSVIIVGFLNIDRNPLFEVYIRIKVERAVRTGEDNSQSIERFLYYFG